jgi:hypothetical protein
MIGNRMCAFALSSAFAIICSTPPAIAGQFDGNWSMVAVTTSGHCGEIPIDVGISRGRDVRGSGFVQGHAGVSWHDFGRLIPTVRARDCRLELWCHARKLA